MNIEKIKKATEYIEVSGNPKGREWLIEKAILDIAENPDTAMAVRYYGIKNYAHFGDQRHDGEYGYGPSHGRIVFSIGRQRNRRGKVLLPVDECIYMLECVRDFGMKEIPTSIGPFRYGNNKREESFKVNFVKYFEIMDTTKKYYKDMDEVIRNFSPEIHEQLKQG